jgi:hypothetical protein
MSFAAARRRNHMQIISGEPISPDAAAVVLAPATARCRIDR